MIWQKLGLIFQPGAGQEWMTTHAALPVVTPIRDDLHRVYFSGRNAAGNSQIGFFEFSLLNPTKTLRVSDRPVVELGELGGFEDSGVTSSCLVIGHGAPYLYYTGWSLGKTVPFYFSVGLAVGDDDGVRFRKLSGAPVLGRHPVDPFLCASPYILVENGLWRMWYVSAVRWVRESAGPKHYYHIRYAESENGIDWKREGVVCIDFKSEDEYAIARPCVVRDGGVYKMWYSFRGKAYRIGYAESNDGIHWIRMDDQAGIDVSPTGWDSEMIEYPCVFDYDGQRYMLYNGNDYGKTGIGLARLT